MTSPSTLPEPADQFITAIENEVKAVLADKASGKDHVSLKGGKKVRSGGDGTPYEYHFTCDKWKKSLDSDHVLVRPSRSRGSWHRASARRQPQNKILVTTDADLGDHPGNVMLREDETRSLRSLADRISDSGQNPGPVNTTTAGWIVGLGAPRVARAARPHTLIAGYSDLPLNQEQRRGVEQALGSDITFVWGPPGTGKTEVVSHIAEGAYRLGERVLFLAPTKVAVDQALERMCELLEGEEDFARGLVQRAGEIEVASLRERFGSVIDAEMIAGRLGEKLSTRAQELEDLLGLTREQKSVHERAALAKSALAHARSVERTATGEASRFHAEATRARADLRQVDESIRQLGTPSGFLARRKAAQIAALTERRQVLCQESEGAAQGFATAEARAEEATDKVRALDRAWKSAAEAVQGLPSASELDETIQRAGSELDSVNKERARLLETIRSTCRVMGTTLAKALQSNRLLDQVDTVIIDEAGMVNLPSAWCAAGLAGKRVVVAGDFRQLPAITQGKGSSALKPEAKVHAERWMDRDAFHAAGLIDSAGTVKEDPRLVSLGVQYRMRPGICEVVNEVAYPDAPLATGRPDDSRLPVSPLLERSVVLVDTSSRRIPLRGWKKHLSNPVHEAVIHELVRGLQFDSVLPARKNQEPGSPAELMAVISPYRDQVNHLRSSLKLRFGEEYEGLADTVHRFQGSQRPLVILDTVAGSGEKPGNFYEGTGLASDTTRLLNVALSRAQDHLVVVADVEYLRKHVKPGSEALHMLAVLENTAQRIPVGDLIPIRSADELGGLSEEELGRPAFFPADEVEKAVEWDIREASKSIEIFSPFLNVQPVNRWLKRLSPRVEQGVRVIVSTRPPSDSRQDDGERQERLIRDLRGKGCEIALRPRMHEKVMILDDTVLWHGSLNLLASPGATDLMMRLTDPGACARVRKIVEAAQQDKELKPWKGWQPAAGAEGTSYGPVPEVGKVVNNRLYLNVPKPEKEDAKRAVKARWHKEVGLWWVHPDTPREKLTRWL
ncbi:AAA domain-containing protein [Nocardiopsis sp. CA-288880]|uniref:AAA domain-containing protein n=1 Tax=Nocardiopsis sp. CA-288880 TaxID=3239995 RepID=UPI003D988058